MSSQLRLVRGALGWGAGSAVAGAAVAWLLRGANGAVSVAIAAALVLSNVVLSLLINTLAERLGPTGPAMMALPSFGFRLVTMFGAMTALDGATFIDEPSFVLSFCTSLTIVLVMEARAWKRTPWLALTFDPKERV